MSFNVSYVANDKVNVETKEKTLAVDIQGADGEKMVARSDYFPIKKQDKTTYLTLINKKEIRDTNVHEAVIDISILSKLKTYEIIVVNTLNQDIRVVVAPDDNTISIPLKDGTLENYDVSSARVNHLIKSDARYVKLSDIVAKKNDVEAVGKKPYEHLFINDELTVRVRSSSAPSSGYVSVYLVGAPY